MKKIVLTSITFLFVSLFVSGQSLPTAPSPMKHVNDLSLLLSNSQKDSLEAQLVLFEKNNNINIYVVSFDSLCGYTSKTFAKRLQQKWNLSPKKLKNTAFIFIKPTGNAGERYLYIAVSRDLESIIPDSVLSNIADNQLIPNFKNKQYYKGFLLATEAIKESVLKANIK
ncbi:MAG: TPM domain-containing protein [Bacteroidota bacterium]